MDEKRDFVHVNIGISRDVWAQVKARCTLEAKSPSDVVEEILREHFEVKER